MAKSNQIEVLVVGAGPVGMLTALLITRHGVKVRIIDQESRTAAHSYACALHPASLCILERAGIANEVIGLGRKVETVALYDGPARRAQAILGNLPCRYPFAVVLAQFLLEELLEEKLRAAGVHVEWHRRLTNLEPGVSGVDAFVESLAPSGRGYVIPKLENTVRRRTRIHAQFIVGADGHNSVTRAQLGIQTIRFGTPQSYGVYEVETAEPVDHEMKLVLDKSGISVLWPLSDNRCRWSFQIPPLNKDSDFPQKDREHLIVIQPPSEKDSFHRLRGILAERAPWFQAQIKDITWVAHAQFEPQFTQHFGKDRCWLAGDAAHQASPAGMQSMNQGLREGADLADTIKAILQDQGDMALLQNYEETHLTAWKHLLGLREPEKPPSCRSPWARGNFYTIQCNLPASGNELKQLVETL